MGWKWPLQAELAAINQTKRQGMGDTYSRKRIGVDGLARKIGRMGFELGIGIATKEIA